MGVSPSVTKAVTGAAPRIAQDTPAALTQAAVATAVLLEGDESVPHLKPRLVGANVGGNLVNRFNHD